MRKYLSLILLSLFVSFSSFAQNKKWDYKWTADKNEDIAVLKQQEVFGDHNYLIFKFNQIPDYEQRQNLKSKGIELLGYVGKQHYWVSILTSSINEIIFENIDIEQVAVPNSSLKRNPYIESVKLNSTYESFVLKLWSADDINSFSSYLSNELGITVVKTIFDRSLILIETEGSQLRDLVLYPAVAYAGPLARNPIPLVDDGISMHRVNAVQAEAPFGPGLSGEGINIGIWDGGIVANHVDLNGNVNNVENQFFSINDTKHATNVAGVIGGKGHKAVRFMGMAPSSHIKTWSFEGDLIQEMNDGIASEDLNIINSSYMLNDYNDPKIEMCNTPGLYVLESAELDKMVRDHPTLTHTIANGNDQATCSSQFPFAGIPIGLQSAKNVINVGWLDGNQVHVGGSNIGPTLDGRFKPDVMSKGKIVTTTQENNLYENTQGSSFSAPAVAGSAALLYEWYFNHFGIFPNASLIRALICNTATDLTSSGTYFGPDYIFGFGRINTLRAYQVMNTGQFVLDNISNSQEKTFNITVPEGLDKINVGIAWSDVEAVPGDLEPLINNIDIKVIGPDNTEYLPWVISPRLWFISATKGIDSVNNIEQVTVQSPAAGNYVISVKGTEIPFGPQDFSITYDFLPIGVKFTHPIGGEKFVPGEDRWIRWDVFGTGAPTLIEISYDNGTTWSTIANLAASVNFLTWIVRDTTAEQCKMRATSGAFQHISETFSIRKRVNAIFGNACDHHLLVKWNRVHAANNYEVLLLNKDLNIYQSIDTITDTFYLFTDVQNAEEYWVSIVARNGSQSALRSDGYNFTPSPINCNFTNDIGVYNFCAPLGFRYPFTGNLQTFNGSLQVLVKNYSASNISGFNVCYQRESGSVVCEPYPDILIANMLDTFTFSVVETFNDTLNYNYNIWTSYPLDANHLNDTIPARVAVVPSYPLPLPYENDFESVPKMDYLSKYFAIDGMKEWDFSASSTTGRLSVGRLEQFAFESQQAITLDKYTGIDSQTNHASLHLNFDGYQDSTIYLDIAYLDHNDSPDNGDVIRARANNTEDWIDVYNFGEYPSIGNYKEVKAINLTDILITQNGQTFGSNFELVIGQEGDGSATFVHRNDGRSFDNIRVYNVGQDIDLSSINIKEVFCDSLIGSFPVEITVVNHSASDAINVPVHYSSSNGGLVSEIIPLIMSGQSLSYQFGTNVNYNPGDIISVDAYVNFEKDFYPDNDTLKSEMVYIRPYASLSFYDDFDNGNNSLIELGTRSSWELGTPDNTIIKTAASGDNAWVTGLMTYYSHGESSYLYGPCFDFSGQSADPNIAFNLQLAIETGFDYFSFEYSEDGQSWNKLNLSPESYNWYNGAGGFWDVDINTWKTASNNLDLSTLTNVNAVVFRNVMHSDLARREEGVGFDDLNITKDIGNNYPMISNEEIEQTTDVNSNWTDIILGNGVLFSIKGDNANDVVIGAKKEAASIIYADNFLLSRHFWLNGSGNFTCKLYLPYSEYLSFPTQFAEWLAPKNMSVLTYYGINPDNTIDNNSNSFAIIEDHDLLIKPYRNGYILEFNAIGNSEFYIRSEFPIVPNVNLAYFTATGINATTAQLDWTTNAEPNAVGFVIEVSEDGLVFDSIDYVLATGSADTGMTYSVFDMTTIKECYMYYRLLSVDTLGNHTFLSTDTASFIYPQIVLIDSFMADTLGEDVLLTWGVTEEKCNDRFEIEYSTDGSNFTFLAAVPSQGDAVIWTPYSYLDNTTIKTGTLYYHLTQYFIDGSFQEDGRDTIVFEDTLTIEWDTVVATSISPSTASVVWNTTFEISVDGFIVQNGEDGINFDSIGYVVSTSVDSMGDAYEFLDSITDKSCLEYYRVVATNDNEEFEFLGMDTASFIYPQIVLIDSFMADTLGEDVLLTWGVTEEKCNDRFEIEYSTDGSNFTFLAAVPSQGDAVIWTPYSYLDNTTIKTGTLYYHLIQYFIDGSFQGDGRDTIVFEDTLTIEWDTVVATSISPSTASVVWNTTFEVSVDGFIVQNGEDGINFDSIGYVVSTSVDSMGDAYEFLDSITDKNCIEYYRVVATNDNEEFEFLGMDTASFIYPQIVLIDSFMADTLGEDVLLTWGVTEEKCNDRFEIEYSTDGSNFTFLAAVPSQGDAVIWTPYSYLDNTTIKTGTLYYHLTQYFIDGSFQEDGSDTIVFEDTLTIEWDTVVATSISPSTASVVWNTTFEVSVDGFIVQNGEDGINFDSIGYVVSTSVDSMGDAYEFLDSITDKNCIEYYRVVATNDNEEFEFLGMDTARFIDANDVNTSSFLAEILGNDVYLSWSITEERCADRFEIEYATDDVNYSFLGSISINDTILSYDFLDNITLKQDTLYYKLYWFSQEETQYYLNTDTVIFTGVFVQNNLLESIGMFYNNGTINLTLQKPFVGMMKVIDSKGSEVYRQNLNLPVGQSSVYLNTWQEWSKAIYFVQFLTSEGQISFKLPIMEQE